MPARRMPFAPTDVHLVDLIPILFQRSKIKSDQKVAFYLPPDDPTYLTMAFNSPLA
jgi:hypothetical protein